MLSLVGMEHSPDSLRILGDCAADSIDTQSYTAQTSAYQQHCLDYPLFSFSPRTMDRRLNSRPETSYVVGQQQVPQSLPPISSLTSELPPHGDLSPGLLRRQQDDPTRDSGNWSLAHSKHSSAFSNTSGSLHLHSILNSDDGPQRNSIPEAPATGRGSLQPHAHLPSLSQGFEQHRSSVSSDTLLDTSRRSSVDSRMGVHMNRLQITPSSPYESQNASRASLASNLQQARVPNGIGAMSPTTARLGVGARAHVTPRRAPVIAMNPRNVSGMPDPTAAAPTKGFPWAFPDTMPIEERRRSSSGDSSDAQDTISRQNSYARSIASSIVTTDSALPIGQRRFDDDIHTHHHSLQHPSVTSLQSTEQGLGVAGSGNYSRTPELRVSHKMAERKRRSEMKGLFDQLNQILPNSPGGKSSKWEILTKAIEHITNLKSDTARISEGQRMKIEADLGRRNHELQNEVAHLWADCQRLEPGRSHVYGQFTAQLQDQARAANPPAPSALPPMQQQTPTQWGPNSSAVMQGIEFGQAYEHR